MKNKVILSLITLLTFATLTTVIPNSNIITTTSNVAYAQEIPDNYYTDEEGTFRVMVRVTKDNTNIKENPFIWAKNYTTAKKGELFNYRGNNLGYYIVARGRDFGDDKGNYTGYIANSNGEVVKLYTDGRIVIN